MSILPQVCVHILWRFQLSSTPFWRFSTPLVISSQPISRKDLNAVDSFSCHKRSVFFWKEKAGALPYHINVLVTVDPFGYWCFQDTWKIGGNSMEILKCLSTIALELLVLLSEINSSEQIPASHQLALVATCQAYVFKDPFSCYNK